MFTTCNSFCFTAIKIFVIMAYRLGHQITCNIKRNTFFRSLSADCSSRYKSFSPIVIKQTINENYMSVVKEKHINVFRTRSLPPPENSYSVPSRRYSSKTPIDQESEESVYIDGEMHSKPPYVKPIKTILREKKISNLPLQPSQLSPIETNSIAQSPSSVPESVRKIQIDSLKRRANAQYEKAVEALNHVSEEESYRYQLEAAKPKAEKGGQVFSVHRKYMKKQILAEKLPQLQPKNIKPYGKVQTIPWSAPKVEYRNRGVFQKQNKKHNKPRRTDSETDLLSRHKQHREYCTVNTSLLEQQSQIEKCKTIISEYKKINPDYTEKHVNLKSGSNEEKQFVEEVDKFISAVKKKNQTEQLQAGAIHDIDASSTKTEIQAQKQDVLGNLSYPSKEIRVSQPSDVKGKVVLYYDVKHGNKVLCSKLVEDQGSQELNDLQNSDNFNEKESEPIKIKLGPKVMLQSSNMQNFEQQAVPALNEKFITPWLSWSDRLKLNAIRANSKASETKSTIKMESYSAPNLSLKKSHPLLKPTAKNGDLIGDKVDKQRRDFSSIIRKAELCNKCFDKPNAFIDESNSNWVDIWNKTNGSKRADELFLKKNLDKNLTSTNRLFSTNSTRGVLGPEGTVMVKLRRLPKINIAEPVRICPEPEKCERCIPPEICEEKPKKLPKFLPLKIPSLHRFPLKDIPLSPLKCRSQPKFQRQVPKCTEELICIMKRADDGLQVKPKKLPKIVSQDCFPCITQEMTTPPLVRLKPRSVIKPAKICKNIIKDICAPRADEGLRVRRRKLPPLKMSNFHPGYERRLVDGPPLKRLKKTKYPDPKRICVEVSEICPPRADDIFGYKVKRKKLKTLIFSERYNNISWQDFKSISSQFRNYTNESKCDMCCYSDKQVRPDMRENNEVIPSNLDKFEGIIHTEENGKMQAYLPPKEVTDTSTGSELKVLKKPIGSIYRKAEQTHEELLKGGFTSSADKTREFSSVIYISSRTAHKDCDIPPEKVRLKDFKIRRLKKRKGYRDHPLRWRAHKPQKEDLCFDPCTEIPRMDDIMKYEVTSKSLPVLPKGKCLQKQKIVPRVAPRPLKRLKKPAYCKKSCPRKVVCEEKCGPRADDNLVVKPRKLPPMVISKCPRPPDLFDREDDNVKFKRLRRVKVREPLKCVPLDCRVTSLPCRADKDENLYRRKNLPVWKAGVCPCQEAPDISRAPKLRRLPPPPFQEREDNCTPSCEIYHQPFRSDVINKYKVKKKKLAVILRSSNKKLSKSFCTLPNNFVYRQNFISQRSFSLSSCLLMCNSKKKKNVQPTTKTKATKFKLQYCQPVAKNISCNKIKSLKPPCTRTKTPYPAFSECKDHEVPEKLTECTDDIKHLQPRYPILADITHIKAPPPHQGKIDPLLEEQCLARKLNIKLEGRTKTCENFQEEDKPQLRINRKMDDSQDKSKRSTSGLICNKQTSDTEDSKEVSPIKGDMCKDVGPSKDVKQEQKKEEKKCQIVEVDCKKFEKSKKDVTCEQPKKTKEEVCEPKNEEKAKKAHCRNVVACKRKKSKKKKSKKKKSYPKKCSDLLKEDKEDTKKTKKSQLSDTCLKTAKPQKSIQKRAAPCPAVASKGPPKSFIDKILDFFRAKPNCPAPDQWKKDKLKRKAEKAAAAAGYELCEKKKSKVNVVKITCKKAGVKNPCKPPGKQGNTDGRKCMSTNALKGTKPGKKSEGSKKSSKSKCKKLPQQKHCEPRARFNCNDSGMVRPPCTAIVPPYPSYSECRKNFKRLPVTECSEQEKNMRRKSIAYDYDKESRKYSTTVQKRYYSSSSRHDDPFLLFFSLLECMKNNELSLKMLAIIQNSIKSIANQSNAKETYYNTCKELEVLCEQELRKNLTKRALDSENENVKPYDSSPNICLRSSCHKTLFDLEQTMMMDAVKQICKTISFMPDISTRSYEESERLKTEKLRKQLDAILDNYRIQ